MNNLFVRFCVCTCSCVHVTQLQLERDELYETFTQSIQKVQHKGDVKIVPLERKLKALADSLEKTQAQLCSVLSASNMDQTALGGVTNKIEVLLLFPFCLFGFCDSDFCLRVALPVVQKHKETCFYLQKNLVTSNNSIKNLQYQNAQISKVGSW